MGEELIRVGTSSPGSVSPLGHLVRPCDMQSDSQAVDAASMGLNCNGAVALPPTGPVLALLIAVA